MTVDTKLHGDQVLEYEGFKVLLVGIEYFNILERATVDCISATLNTELIDRAGLWK